MPTPSAHEPDHAGGGAAGAGPGGPGWARATRLARLLTFGARRPRVALAIWLAATATLAVVGLGVGQHLAGTSLNVPGSESAREAQLATQQFGKSVSAPILLTGPRKALDGQSRLLARRLSALPGAEVISPWDGSSLGRSLRPSPTSALLLVADSAQLSTRTIERSIKNVVDATIAKPVRARVSGLDAIGVQLESASLQAVHQAELIAIPVLLVVLLLVFGSPLAAAIPAALGLGTVFASFGVISLVGSMLPLTVFATSAASMMGLALGVDYSLLVVSRFRDELSDPGDRAEILRAASVAGLRAGRTVLFAGGAIALLMMCALAVAAGTLLLSAVVAVIIVAAISVASTVLAAPAALALLGGRLGRTRVKAGARPQSAAAYRPSALARVCRSPAVVLAALGGLIALGIPALSLATGAPDASQLPAGSSARSDYQALTRRVGPGWITPFEMLAVVRSGSITTHARLNALARAQRLIARDGDVATVIGPGGLAQRVQPLDHAAQTAAATNQSLGQSAQDLATMGASLSQAANGADAVQGGFAKAVAAVGSLAHGAGGGGQALSALDAGLQQAAAGSRETNAGLVAAEQAAQRVVAGGRSAAAGMQRLTGALSGGTGAATSAGSRISALADALHAGAGTLGGLAGSVSALDSGTAAARARLASATQTLMHMSFVERLDPRYRTLVAAVQSAQSALDGTPSAAGIAGQISAASATEQGASAQARQLAGSVGGLSTAASRLEAGAQAVGAGIAALERGQQALATGIARLTSSEAALTQGLGMLSSGTQTLGARLAALQAGAAQLSSGLAGEQSQSARLASALSSGKDSASVAAKRAPGQSDLLTRLAHSPKFFSSGYLVLAALQGTPADQRGALNYTLNLTRDGQAARILIVPRSAAGASATGALRHRLQRLARELAQTTGAQVTLGGPAAQLRDYTTATAGRMPLLIGVLMLATFLLLVPVFRSVLAPLVGVLLNLLSVAAAFGGLSLLSGGHHPLIGGPGYVDALSVSAIFSAMFALSIDYQVFLLMRMREGWMRTGSVSAGVEYGVSRTARVVVGAAAIMTGVFLAFASADVATVRQLGVGLAIAIAIDSTVVRLVLLPWALRLGGRFTWWLPAWLEQRLPAVDIGGERRHADRPLRLVEDHPVQDRLDHGAGAVPQLARVPALLD